MKKLILAIALVMTTLTFAQNRKQGREKLTPEQQTELQVKRMTLDLDLDAKQQKDVKALLLEQAKKRTTKVEEMKSKRENGEKPSTDEKYALKNEILNNQIEMKAKMKEILTPEQYKKWEEKRDDKEEKVEERMQKRKRASQSN